MTRYVNIRGPAGYVVPSDDSLAGLPNHNVKSTPLTHEEMNRNLVTMAGAISDLEKYQLPATASVSVDEGKLRYNAATKEVEVNDGAGWTRTAEFESHQHPQSDIIGLELGIAGAISSKADIASPNFLGTPTAPTAPAAQTGNAIATLDFVHANDAILQTAIDGKANIASPAFTGAPTAPTPVITDNSTKIATTQYVNDAVLGVGAINVTGHQSNDVIYLTDEDALKETLQFSGTLTSPLTFVLPEGPHRNIVFSNICESVGGVNGFTFYIIIRKRVTSGVNSVTYVDIPINTTKIIRSTFGEVVEVGVKRSEIEGTVKTSGDQSIDGLKTFTGPITVDGTVYIRAPNEFSTGVGWATLSNNYSTTINNTAMGYESMRYNTTGFSNTAVGFTALKFNTGGNHNTAVGSLTLNTNTAGYANTAIGSSALYNNTIGYANTAIGSSALYNNTTTDCNTAIGSSALYSNWLGEFNTAVGANALDANTGGHHNTAVGYDSLKRSTGGRNTAMGSESLIYNNTGSFNTSIGAETLGLNTSGDRNTAIGAQASFNNVTGLDNTALGYGALFWDSAYVNTTGVGAGSAVTGSHQVQLGAPGTTTYVYGTVQDRSDIRDKADIRDTVLGLDFINSLRPVDYKWDMRDSYREDTSNAPVKPTPVSQDADAETKANYEILKTQYEADNAAFIERNKLENIVRDGSKKRSRYHHGLIAQEVKELLDTKGIDFGGFQDHKVAGGDDVMSIGYDELIAPLIKAVQELSARVKELEASAASVNSTP